MDEFLRRLTGATKRRQFGVVDIEALHWVEPYAIGCYDGNSYADWVTYKNDSCLEHCLAHVFQPKYSGWWFYAHNGGNYDFLFLVRKLLRKRAELRVQLPNCRVEITPIQSCMFRLDVIEIDDEGEPTRNRWTFLDSVRLLPLKLNEVGETFGIGKKVDTQMSYTELASPRNEALMRKYLKTDCTLLHRAVCKMQDSLNALGGQLQMTLPSSAMDLFRRRFLRDDIYINRHFVGCKDADCDTRVNKAELETICPPGLPAERPHYKRKFAHSGSGIEPNRTESDTSHPRCQGCGHSFFRAAYFGGRVEIFRMQGRKLQLLDINSHYPSCMLEPMPVGRAVLVDGGKAEDILSTARRLVGIVECEVWIPDDCYLPPLPVRHKGKLLFPTGAFRGVWDAAELELVPLCGGAITKVHRVCWFEAKPVFAAFVKELYKFRDKRAKNWNKGMDWIAKILMNSLYGKTGMIEDRQRVLIRPDSLRGGNLKPLDLESDVWVEPVHLTPQYVVPQLACHVTALARQRLWRILRKVLDMGGRIYYCDTDSVVCDDSIEMPVGPELGALKLEHRIRRAEFVLPKLYKIETEEHNKLKRRESGLKIKSKGLSPGLRTESDGDDELAGQLSEREFDELAHQGMKVQRRRIAKFKESLAAFSRLSTEFPRIQTMDKRIMSEYDKRRVVGEGPDTAPHHYTNL